MWGVQVMNFMNYPNCILFDLDGVILDTESVYMNLMLNFNKRYNLNISEEYYISNYLGKTRQQINQNLLKNYLDEEMLNKYWIDLLNYRDQYLCKTDIKVKEGFNELLKYLKDNSFIVGIVSSNSLKLIKNLLKKVKIDINQFDVVITREDVSITKPYPDLYLKALSKLNIKNKKNVIAIEDSNVGIISAFTAGIKVINVRYIDVISDNNKDKCINIVNSLLEIINILEEKRF